MWSPVRYCWWSRPSRSVADEAVRAAFSNGQSSVDDQREQDSDGRGHDGEAQPAGAGGAGRGLVANLVLHRGVASVEFIDVGGLVRLPARHLSDVLEHLGIHRNGQPLILDLDIAVGGAERDGRYRHASVFRGASGGIGAARIVGVSRLVL